MKRIICLLAAMFLLLPSLALKAQDRSLIKGRVLDGDGVPVVGAVVLEITSPDADAQREPANAVMSDAEGKFSIRIIRNDSELEASCVGYLKTRVRLPQANRGEFLIILKEDVSMLEETVVIAFGKQKKDAFAGASATVKSESIALRQSSNPLNALNGNVTGLQMVESNSPDGDPSIRIRGIGSINASNSPLIVLDGMPYNGYWSDINPSDVESITVLKDASSNALYGARGANGVIMITTKAAKRGQAVITFDSRIGINQDALVDYDTIDDPAQYYMTHLQSLYNYYSNGKGEGSAEAFNHAYQAMLSGSDAGGLGYMVYSAPEGQNVFSISSGRIIMNPKATLGGYATDSKGIRHLLVPDDWRREGLRNGLRQEYNLNINGSDERFQYYSSLGYTNNQGISYGSDYERISARLKANYQAKPWLTTGASASFTHNEGNYNSGAFGVAHSIAPIYPLYIRDAEGNIMTDEHGVMYDWGDDFGSNRSQDEGGLVRPSYIQDNPVQADILDVNKNESNSFGVQGFADISLSKDLTLTLNGSFYDTENRSISANNPYYGYYAITGSGSTTYHYRTTVFNTQQLLSYSRTFASHSISVLAGHEYNRDGGTVLGASKSKFYSFDRNVELDGSLIKTDIEGNSSMYNVEGYFTRAQYEYADKYFASASYRRDGSSRFAKDYRWGNFWSVGGAWMLSKEGWFTLDAVNLLKLKASYGSQGNDGIGNFRYTDYYSYGLVNGYPTISFSSKGKEDITWETNGNFNAGLEFEILGSRVRGGVDFYNRLTTDMLLYVNTPASVGFGGYYDNIGDMLNRGVEIELFMSPVRSSDINWDINFNISHNRNEVVRLNDDNRQNSHEYNGVTYYGKDNGYKFIGEGLPLNTWLIRQYAGVDEKTGKSLWYKADGSLTDSYSAASYQLSGNSDPVVYGGFGTSLYYYGFELSLNFLYSLGGLVLDQGYSSLMAAPYSGNTGFRYHSDLLNAWTEDNSSSSIPRFQYGDQTVANISDRFLTDASTLTFKNASIAYNLPMGLLKRLNINRLKLSLSCENIMYISARKGFDPRTTLSGYASYGGYSPVRSISLGVNAQF